ncbi:hypothetical protein PMI35_03408 [Pseudomonas sp. GM78]|nr:hypothetical protein PMI35_03408 [Pseudomonas sp. GM78]
MQDAMSLDSLEGGVQCLALISTSNQFSAKNIVC